MIHKTAIVDPNAKISKNVKIGPWFLKKGFDIIAFIKAIKY